MHRFRCNLDIARRAQPFEQPRLLEHHADPRRAAPLAQVDLPAIGFLKPGGQMQQRGLADAGGANQRDQFARRHIEREIFQHRARRGIARTLEELGDMTEVDAGTHTCASRFQRLSRASIT